MKHILILLFALGITIAATSTVLAQERDESAGSAGSVDECRPLLTPEGAAPDTSTCSETQGQLVANYRGTTITDIDRFEKTGEAKANRASKRSNLRSQESDTQKADK